MSFVDILKKGKRQFQIKDQRGSWGKCEYCDTRQLLFQYTDDKNELWHLCGDCTGLFIKEEG